jgi:hypothetical protein
MKDFGGKLQYKGKEYNLVFNLNVMQSIQSEYGTLDKWSQMTDGKANGEPDAGAVIFGFREMLNEGIEIQNEDDGTEIKPLTLKQVGRIITEVGIQYATNVLNQTVIDSTQSAEKNA